VGLILDLAVAALALLVIGSLALLAWKLSVSAVGATRQGRASVAESRRAVASLEDRLPTRAAAVAARLAELAERTRSPQPGDRPDA
jgi:hypothetical protein